MADADVELPQLYLITPAEVDLMTYPDILAACLDAADIGCVRLALGTKEEDRIAKTADALREVTHARDVALVIDTHIQLVERLGLDGVHLTDGARSVKKVRKELGADAIVGSFCGTSRHDGMTAGELGVDYVAFGPCGQTALGDGSQAEIDLFEWWSTMIEVPIVAEGALTKELITKISPHTDFFGIGDEIWSAPDPLQAFADLRSAIVA
jgi:thiamine-phosphate pyrophosphorylase